MTELAKYPRTWHLPFSQGLTRDDRIMLDGPGLLLGRPLVLTEKMDGSNVVLRRTGVFPRARWHESMNPLRALQATIGWQLPEHIDLCAEWLLATHSIHYDRLSAYCQVFAAFDGQTCTFLSWSAVTELTRELGLVTVPVLQEHVVVKTERELVGLVMRHAAGTSGQGEAREGVVVRVADEIPLDEFGRLVGKYVRAGHVDEDGTHWAQGPWRKNTLVGGA